MADSLRARIAEVLNTEPARFVRENPDSVAFHYEQPWCRHDKHSYMATCALCRGETDTLTDAVMAVVQEELDKRGHDADEVVRCHGLHCLNTEFYARLEARGWQLGGMGTWLCPDCKPTTKESLS
jgi:hypothetical protein